MKKYNRTLLVALLIVAVFATAIGGTFAWFTDSEESTGNIIKSGTLDVEVEAKSLEADSQYASIEEMGPLFNYTLWEPGYVDVKQIKITNAGDLAFKYKVTIKAADAEETTSEYNLADVIDVYVLDDEPNRDIIADAKPIGTISQLMAFNEIDASDYDGVLLPAEDKATDDYNTEDTVGVPGSVEKYVALKMQESAGNEYQNLPIKDGFSLVVYAAQYTWENDEFDHNYDKDAEFDTTEGPNANVTAPAIPPADKGEPIYPPSFPFETPTDYTTSDLDLILKFSAMETADEAAASKYADWHADFIVYADEDVPANSIMLAGQYDYNEDLFPWIGLTADEVITAGTKIRLVGSAGLTVNYEEVCTFKDFYCGAMDITGDNAGTTITVELWLFEATGGSMDSEAGEKIKIGTYTHTF